MNIIQLWLQFGGGGGGINPLAFIFKVTTQADNELVTLPLQHDDYAGYDYVFDFEVQYDKDSPVPVVAYDDTNATYVFPTAGEHIITITGVCEAFSVMNAITPIQTQITEILQWGSVGAKALDISTCSLVEYIPSDLVGGFSSLLTISGMFFQCSGITEIPEGLLDSAVNLIDGTFCFGMTNITEIPATLFANNVLLENLYGAFWATDIIEIPETLFANLSLLRGVATTFKDCTLLTSIPPLLFAGNGQLRTASGVFENTAIGSIPSELFGSCSLLQDVSTAFRGCTNITAISVGLFGPTWNILTFRQTFEGCTSLASVNNSLFLNCGIATTFEATFASCTALTTLPSQLFAQNVNVTSFKETFKFCQNLTSTPSNLFAGSAKVTSYEGVFWGCIRLATINANTFPVYNTKTINFYEGFKTCNALTAIPSNLFDNMPNITGFVRTFHIPSAPGLITSALPALWSRSTPGLVKTDCFHNRTAASNYATATSNGWT